jgi:hypothetical protein
LRQHFQDDEMNWLSFETILPYLVGIQNWSERRAKGAMIQKYDIGIKDE